MEVFTIIFSVLVTLLIGVPCVSWWLKLIDTIKLRNKLRKEGYGGFADDINKILHNK